MKRRKTKSKKEIFNVLKSSGSALSHDMIQSELESDIDRATIYRVLNRFHDDGVVHKIVGDDGKQYFALCPDCGEKNEAHTHHHFHFRCLACEKVECLDDEVSISLPKGYVSANFNGIISGYCRDCR